MYSEPPRSSLDLGSAQLRGSNANASETIWPAQDRCKEVATSWPAALSRDLDVALRGCLQEVKALLQKPSCLDLEEAGPNGEMALHTTVRTVTTMLHECLAHVAAKHIIKKTPALNLQLLRHGEDVLTDYKPMQRRYGGVTRDRLAFSHIYHLGLSPLERQLRAGARALAFVDLILRQQFPRFYPDVVLAGMRPLVIWVIGATDKEEGELACRRYFDDVAGLAGTLPHKRALGMPFADVFLLGSVSPKEYPCGDLVRVQACGPVDFCGLPTTPADIVVSFHSRLGGLLEVSVEESLSLLSQVLRPVHSASHAARAPLLLLTSRSEVEAHAEESLLRRLGVEVVLPPTRNLFSGSAADSYTQYDDHGWFVLFHAARPAIPTVDHLWEADVAKVCTAVRAEMSARFQSSPGTNIYGKVPLPKDARSTAVFWGILDLKYDPEMPVGKRVKVLEMGDGRSSRFSGYGARIKEAFKTDHKVEESLHHGVLFENKKLTHDFIVERGYSHILPKQLVFPRVYTSELAVRIIAELGCDPEEGVCVLKLCNKARGAGCIPIRTSELNETLRHLLTPPKDINAWLGGARDSFISRAIPGCFDEQLRHWWSNECPCFIVEDLCLSTPTHKKGCQYDGTMRVGFLLHREEDEKAHEEPRIATWESVPDNTDLGSLRTLWLGGYWKLPEADINSEDLRGRIISKAKQGTALVKDAHLHEVYAAVGDAVSQLFSSEGKEISPYQMSIRYESFPEFAAFLVARLSSSLRDADYKKKSNTINFAHLVNSKAQKGLARAAAESYIHRIAGVFEALQGKWNDAELYFQKSLKSMPANATTHYLHGMCLLEAGAWHDAIKAMEASLQLDPDFKAPYINIAVAWIELKIWHKVIEVSEMGIHRHPQAPHCLYHLGVGSYMVAHESPGSIARTRTGKTLVELRTCALESLTTARDHLKRNRREGVHRGARPAASPHSPMSPLPNSPSPRSLPSPKSPSPSWPSPASPLASSTAKGPQAGSAAKVPDGELKQDSPPVKKIKSLWTPADDDLVKSLELNEARLKIPERITGWKFYGWRP